MLNSIYMTCLVSRTNVVAEKLVLMLELISRGRLSRTRDYNNYLYDLTPIEYNFESPDNVDGSAAASIEHTSK